MDRPFPRTARPGPGSLHVVDLANAEVAQAFARNDPYHQAGLFNIIQIDLDFTFTDGAVSNLAKLDTSSDEYRKGLYALLAPGAHLFNEGQPVQRTYGYWPKQADRNSAKQLTLFYVVPRNRTTQSLRFVYDGAVLGEGGSGIDTTIQPG